MTASRVGDYLNHILEATRLACSYTAGMTREEFLRAGCLTKGAYGADLY